MSSSLAIRLLTAAAEGNRHFVATLLYQGADTAYCQAGARAGLTPLHVAAENGYADIVDMLLAHGGKTYIDAPDQNGRTPLHNAAAGGHVETTRLLLNGGAKHDLKDKQGNTALHLAAMLDDQEEFSALTTQNNFIISKESSDHTRTTADTVRVLLRHHANPETKNNNGKTALDLTRSLQVKVLLQRELLALNTERNLEDLMSR
jgi:uncharacterized protein